MTTILFLIEPCPPAPHRFLDRLAAEPGSPLVSTETAVHYRRLDYMPHAYLAVVTLEHGDREDLRDAIHAVIAESDMSGELYTQKVRLRAALNVFSETSIAFAYPQATALDVLNVDMRGLPLGVDRAFSDVPEWSLTYSDGRGIDVISMGQPCPADSMFPPEPDFDTPHAEQDPPVYFEAIQDVQYIPDLDIDETRDLTLDELRLFRPDHETDPWWPEAKIFDF